MITSTVLSDTPTRLVPSQTRCKRSIKEADSSVSIYSLSVLQVVGLEMKPIFPHRKRLVVLLIVGFALPVPVCSYI